MGESQEDNNERVCQKCGKNITQVPYKYEGKHFHARCLICSTCGNKLAGKPFLTDGNKIFCGEQCRSSHEEVDLPITTTTEAGNETNIPTTPLLNGRTQHSESLLEALKNTEQSVSSLSLTRSQSPLQTSDISTERITDYPGHSRSPSQSPGSVRRVSLSISESSLASSMTSEGSFGFDGNKHPKKRILKKPHTPKKLKSNRVRWNIPEQSGDTLSLESFESSSTASGRIYQQARNSVNESRKNWREFEENPPPGSTGLTPAKIPLAPLKENSPHVGYTPGDHSPSSLSPPHSPNSRPPLAQNVGIIETRNGVELGRSVSPLQYSTRMSPPPSGHQTTSTPVQPNHIPSPTHNHVNSNGGVDSTPLSPPTSVPVLKLDHSNLSELEASTLEDRVKSNLFEIPTKSLDPLRKNSKNSPTPVYSGYIPPEGMAHLCGGDDEDDYDHLSPVKLTTPSPSDHKLTRFDLPFFSQKPRSTSDSLPAENSTAPQLFGDNDIDEALNELKDSSSSRSSSAPQSPTDLFPPSRAMSLHREAEQQEEPSTMAVQKGPDSLKLQEPTTTTRQSQSQPVGYFRHSKQQPAMSPEGIPPPVPPKLRRQKSSSPPSNPDHSTQSNHSPSFYPSSISSHPHSKQTHCLPDFASGPVQVVQSSDLSQEEGCDDALSSVSNATLVPDPSDSSPTNIHSDHSTAPDTPRQGTKFGQNNETVGVKRGGVLNPVNPSSTRLPPTAHVHPEPYLPHTLSSLNYLSWKDSGSTSGTNFAPHPRTLPYESCLPERQSVITVSNFGSDSSPRGVSPPEKVTHAVIQTRTHGNCRHPLNRDKTAALVQPISQPLPPARPASAQTQLSGHRTGPGGPNQTYFQAPHCQNPPGEGNSLSRNHRLYHSQRLSAVTRPRQRTLSGSKEGGSDNFLVGGSSGVRPPQQGNPRGMLKFQPVNSFETPLDEIMKMPPQFPHYQYHTKALSQDDQLMVGTFYHGGLVGGHGRSKFRGTKGTVHSYLTDIDGYEGKKDGGRRYYGPCALCHKNIIGGLKICGQLRYHSTCFKCSVCGLLLKTQNAHKIGDQLFCIDHSSTNNHSILYPRRISEGRPPLPHTHPSLPHNSHSHNGHPTHPNTTHLHTHTSQSINHPSHPTRSQPHPHSSQTHSTRMTTAV